MVSSSSAAAQAAENEKRKKQTMEKVKVNHVCFDRYHDYAIGIELFLLISIAI